MLAKDELKQSLFADIDAHREEYIRIAAHLFEHPETANEETESAAYLTAILKENGFEVECPYCGLATGFKATKKNGEGPRIAYMAEYDALPGLGHACGHNWIAATSLGAGITLAKALSEYPGEVTIFGTPAEETGDGKPVMVDAGAFDGYDAALEFHGHNRTCLKPDMIGIGGIDIHFCGKAAHAGALPYEGVNALDAVVLFYNAVGVLRQQIREGARIHGIIVEGGQAPNIIPDSCTIRIEIRYPEMTYWEELLGKVVRCAEGAALATGCEMEWHHFEPTCASVKHNRKLVDLLAEILADYPQFAEEGGPLGGGSSDVGNVSQVVPTLHPMMKITEVEEGPHTAAFCDSMMGAYSQDRAIEVIKIFTEIGLRLLADPELAKSLRE